MKLKYILALVLFFGNLFAALLVKQRRDIAAGKLVMPMRQRILMLINEFMGYVVIVLVLLFFYVILFR